MTATVAAMAARQEDDCELCFSHRRFGTKARRCIPPCFFPGPGKRQGQRSLVIVCRPDEPASPLLWIYSPPGCTPVIHYIARGGLGVCLGLGGPVWCTFRPNL